MSKNVLWFEDLNSSDVSRVGGKCFAGLTDSRSSNVILTEAFCEGLDHFWIGSNDFTLPVLGLDRDSWELSELFDEKHQTIKAENAKLVKAANKAKRIVGTCGRAPSDCPGVLVET